MPIAGSSGSTSTVTKAYGYALAQKTLWLNTGGAKGANVNGCFVRRDEEINGMPVWEKEGEEEEEASFRFVASLIDFDTS